MIQDLDPEQPARLDEARRQLHVVLRRLRVAGGMVVSDDDRGGRGG